MEHVLPILGTDAFVLCVTENPQAIAFYQCFGFIPAARFPGEAQGYRCQCVRLTLATSVHRLRPPTPAQSALRLAGFTKESPGQAVLDAHGIYIWQ